MVASVRRAAQVSRRWLVDEGVEIKAALKEAWVFARKHNWIKTFKLVFRRKYWGWWFALAFTVALSAVLSSYHSEIIGAISPYRRIIKQAPGSWIVPVVVLIIVSFPPLFGHELIILVVGVIYGLAWGFAIACLGTFLGELACFYAFRYWFTNRAKKIETKNLTYGCLAKLMREGGVGIIILVRFSAVPGHVTTAIQSTIGMSVWIYSIAATVSLPKQFAIVYLGYVFGQTTEPIEVWRLTHGPEIPSSVYYSGAGSVAKRHKISLIVFAATTLATIIALWVVWRAMRKVRPFVVAEMEERARQLALSSASPEETSETGFDARKSLGMLDIRRTEGSDWTRASQIALLSSPHGSRSRADTLSKSPGFESPSMPHLPLSDEALQDYFNLLPEEKPNEINLARRGSA